MALNNKLSLTCHKTTITHSLKMQKTWQLWLIYNLKKSLKLKKIKDILENRMTQRKGIKEQKIPMKWWLIMRLSTLINTIYLIHTTTSVSRRLDILCILSKIRESFITTIFAHLFMSFVILLVFGKKLAWPFRFT
jgi:hypothetical protein